MSFADKIISYYQANHNQLLALKDERAEAFSDFKTNLFPTKKDEEYKYTNLAPVLAIDYNLEPTAKHSLNKSQLSDLHLGEESFDYIVFINGVLHAEWSKISFDNAQFLSLAHILESEQHRELLATYYNQIPKTKTAVAQLNAALANFGFFLHIPKNTKIEKPIHVFYLSQGQDQPSFYSPRNLVIAEQGAQVEIIESHHNFDQTQVFTNAVTEIYTKANAKVDWHKLQNDAENTYLIDSTYVKQDQDSLATVNTFTFGGKLVRNNLDFVQNGSNINSFMNGITIINNEQLVDHHTAVHHDQPHCESYQNYKGVYNGQSHGVFNGKVFVDKIAQKTNAYQQNNNVILSQGAKVDTKPQLEIFADDVKCSHGCTIGQLDSDALFYLRARGISKEKAQALLLYAFCSDATERIEIEALKNKVNQLLTQKLGVEIDL
jgi:Fe-S cluster assembly protein SufD